VWSESPSELAYTCMSTLCHFVLLSPIAWSLPIHSSVTHLTCAFTAAEGTASVRSAHIHAPRVPCSLSRTLSIGACELAARRSPLADRCALLRRLLEKWQLQALLKIGNARAHNKRSSSAAGDRSQPACRAALRPRRRCAACCQHQAG